MATEYEKIETNLKGINQEYIFNSIKIEGYLQCMNCCLLVIDPVFCHTCKKTSCLDCIKKKLCSFCNNEVDQLPAEFENLFSELKIKCIFSMNGCDDVIQYNQYIDHIKYCFYNLYKCKNCEFKSNINNMENHINKCENSKINCIICNQVIKRKEYASHNNTDCVQEIENLIKPCNYFF